MIKKFIFIVFVALFVFVLNVFFADRLSAHIATWNWVKKAHLVEPRAPLVINTREEIRVNETNDIISALSRNKNKVGALFAVGTGAPQLKGAVVVATSNGLVLTSRLAVGDLKAEQLSVQLDDGKRYSVSSIIFDPASNVVALQTNAAGLSVVTFAVHSDIFPGERVMLLGENVDGGSYFLASFLSSAEFMPLDIVSSDVPNRVVSLQPTSGVIPGQSVMDLSGKLIGIWDGQKLISSTILQEVVTGLLAANGKIIRPFYGFNYRFLSNVLAASEGRTPGLLISKSSAGTPAVIANSPAAKAGLLEGDIITKINNQAVGDNGIPEALLLNVSPQTKIFLQVKRAGQILDISITPSAQ